MAKPPTKRETVKLTPICAAYGKTPAQSRILISDGRKVGFVLDYGRIKSRHCFQMTPPTQTFGKTPRPPGTITLVTDGWKVVVDIKGCLYLGEIRYSDSCVPLYRFARLDGSEEVDSSDFCDAPSAAFMQVNARHPKTQNGQLDERPNGKLYMAIQYSEPQQVLRDEFTRNRPCVPSDAIDIFEKWLAPPVFAPPMVHASSSSSLPPPSPMIQMGARGFNSMSNSLSSSSISLSAAPLGPEPRPGGARIARKRTSDSLGIDFTHMAVSNPGADLGNSKKLNTIKEVVQNVHENLSDATLKEADLVSPSFKPPLQDTIDPFNHGDVAVQDIVKILRADSMENLGLFLDDTEDDVFRTLDRRLSANMSAEELFNALKHPQSEMLTRAEMKRAVQTLLQMPVPSILLEETFNSFDIEGTGKVTLQNFVQAIQKREHELWQQFQMIDIDGSGEITLDELRVAHSKGLFEAQERELEALLEAMDRLSQGTGNAHHAVDRKIQWSEFRAMMILLPPATTVQTIVNLVKDKLDEQEQLQGVELDLDYGNSHLFYGFGLHNAHAESHPKPQRPLRSEHMRFDASSSVGGRVSPTPLIASTRLSAHDSIHHHRGEKTAHVLHHHQVAQIPRGRQFLPLLYGSPQRSTPEVLPTPAELFSAAFDPPTLPHSLSFEIPSIDDPFTLDQPQFRAPSRS